MAWFWKNVWKYTSINGTSDWIIGYYSSLYVQSIYKQSAYCQSEAEYAYARQQHIIPLVMEKQYRPDGWLGFICASKMYVDFTKTDFEQAFQKLISQIQLHNRRISSTMKDEKNEPMAHDDGSSSVVKHATETSVTVRLFSSSSRSKYRISRNHSAKSKSPS